MRRCICVRSAHLDATGRALEGRLRAAGEGYRQTGAGLLRPIRGAAAA
jgi:hypothetical protein